MLIYELLVQFYNVLRILRFELTLRVGKFTFGKFLKSLIFNIFKINRLIHHGDW